MKLKTFFTEHAIDPEVTEGIANKRAPKGTFLSRVSRRSLRCGPEAPERPRGHERPLRRIVSAVR